MDLYTARIDRMKQVALNSQAQARYTSQPLNPVIVTRIRRVSMWATMASAVVVGWTSVYASFLGI